jgi:hypothetical protein
MTKQVQLWAALAALLGVLVAAPAATGAGHKQCDKTGGGVVQRHANALCRSLARRARAERPSAAWSATWSDRCAGVSDSESRCTFRMVFRDRSEPRSERRPTRTCRGEATVTGTSTIHVAYDGGCVYPETTT